LPETASAVPPPSGSKPPAEASAGNRQAPVIALIAGGLALAAAVAFVVRSKNEAPPSSVEAQAPAATAPLASAAPATPPAPPPEHGVNVDELPGTAGEPQAIAEAPARSHSPTRSKREPMAARAPEPAAPLPATKPAASAPSEPELKPADGRMGPPEKPSTGAVQAALGSVIGGARSCVSGQERPSSATVVFGSDGRVQSVAVSGAAAGTPAAACIRSALEKARVHPFAKPTFSASVTIRPN
jgi:hypothetical protein